MRLIDADALKEEINKRQVVGRFNTIQLIDNAPTVTPDMAQVLAYECGKASVERLIGKWIYDEDSPIGGDIYHCSICNRSITTTLANPIELYPFCHCGARMKVENE